MNFVFLKVLVQILLRAGCCALYQLSSGDLLASSAKCHLENRAFPLRE